MMPATTNRELPAHLGVAKTVAGQIQSTMTEAKANAQEHYLSTGTESEGGSHDSRNYGENHSSLASEAGQKEGMFLPLVAVGADVGEECSTKWVDA